jgi:hypothetical protein
LAVYLVDHSWRRVESFFGGSPAEPLLRVLCVRYALDVSQSPSDSTSTGSLGRTIVAILILLVVGYFLLHVLIGVAVAIAGFAVVIFAIVAIIWAVRVLF